MTEPNTLTKLIVMYMLDKVDFPLTKAQLYEFILGKEYSTYFALTQTICALVDDGFITSTANHSTTFLSLTQQGRDTLAYFHNRISDGIKNDINKFFDENRMKIANEVSVMSNYYRTSGGDFVADLTAKDKTADLINIRLNMPTEDSARAICEHWRDSSSDIYSFILEKLL